MSNVTNLAEARQARGQQEPVMSGPDGVTLLDLDYRDPRGIFVHVTSWSREKQQVYFTRPNYPHECMQPVWKFQQYFTRLTS